MIHLLSNIVHDKILFASISFFIYTTVHGVLLTCMHAKCLHVFSHLSALFFFVDLKPHTSLRCGNDQNVDASGEDSSSHDSCPAPSTDFISSSCDDNSSYHDDFSPHYSSREDTSYPSHGSNSSSWDDPSHPDTHYHPRNVKRRENRKKEKVARLQREIRQLKHELKEKDNLIHQL